jgi:hypothetical protein
MICTIGGHFAHDKRVYMDPLISGKVPSPRFHIPDIAGSLFAVCTPLGMIGMRDRRPAAIGLRLISKLRIGVYLFATSSFTAMCMIEQQ